MKAKFDKYKKFVVATAGSAALVALSLADLGAFGKWSAVVIAVATALGVRQVKNTPVQT